MENGFWFLLFFLLITSYLSLVSCFMLAGEIIVVLEPQVSVSKFGLFSKYQEISLYNSTFYLVMKTNELMLNGIILQSFGSDNVAHEAE